MAFPTTGYLDQFNRPNEGPPPSSSWRNLNGVQIYNNHFVAPGYMSYYNTAYGPDCDAYVTLTTSQATIVSQLEVWARYTPAAGTGYFVRPSFGGGAPDLVSLYRHDGGGSSAGLGSWNVTIADGDKYGIRCIGNNISVYQYTGGAWNLLGTVADATYPGAGYCGLNLYCDNGVWPYLYVEGNDFGAGDNTGAAFPEPGVVDSGVRADEGPPPSVSWRDAGGLSVIANQAGDTGVYFSGASSRWDTITGADCEVCATVATRPTDTNAVYLYARLGSTPIMFRAYVLYISRDDGAGDSATLLSLDLSGAGIVPIGSAAIVFQDGDAFGLQCVGTAIKAYQKPVAGAWTEIISVGDASVAGAGYIALSMSETTTRLDDFGGGDYVPPVGPAPTATLTASLNPITTGGSTTLTWTTADATSASIDQGIGAVGLNGSLSVSPSSTTTYTITAVGPGGTTTASVTVTVLSMPTAHVSNNGVLYELWLLHHAYGYPLGTFESSNIQYTKVVQGVGSFKIEVLPTFDWSLVQEDTRVVVWRTPSGGTRQIDFVGFVRMPQKTAANGLLTRILNGPDLHELLKWRVHAFTDDANTAWRGVAMDDIMKDVVRRNLGASATGTGRNLSAYGFSVQKDLSAGRVSGARRNGGYHAMMRSVLDICQELSALSAPRAGEASPKPQQFFGIAPLVIGWECEFRTNSQQWGMDHRNQVIFGLDWGNIESADRAINYQDEATVAYTLGDWTEGSRVFNEYNDNDRIQATPFNRREMVVEASGMDEDTLQGLGASAVRANRPRKSFSAKIMNVGSRVYGRDYGLGDYVTAVFDGEVFHCRIETVTVTVTGETESVDITLREETQ